MATLTYEQVKQEVLNQAQRDKMCLENFLLELKDELTVSCSIPIKIPDKNLINIIKRAVKWFHKHYEYSVEHAYYYVNRAAYNEDQFRSDRSIILPENIFSVFNIHKVDYYVQYNTYDFINYNNQSLTFGVKNTFEDIMGYVLGEKYISDRDSLLVKKYTAYQFNNLTNKLTLTGEVPDTDLVIEVYRTIPNCALFKDELFFRYVLALAQKNISMVLGMFAYNLPGNITINYDLIEQRGSEAIDKIETEIKEDEGTDYFFIG